MKIKYIKGDATKPIGEGNKIIPHICNNINKWGKGFVLAVSNRWLEPEKDFKSMPIAERYLGNVRHIKVEHNIWIANMIAQNGIMTVGNKPPIRYDALRECLKTVRETAVVLGASIHMPRIGAGLAGGSWTIIESIIEEELFDLEVFVYDLK